MKRLGDRFDVVVVGGGPAGIMAAGQAALRGRRVLLLEKNKRLGEKLRISGGGRCNIANAEDDVRELLTHYGTAKDFLHSSFATFSTKDTFAFFETLGLPLVVEERKRAFPHTKKAEDVARVLETYLERAHVEVRKGRTVDRIIMKAGRIDRVVCKMEEYSADSFIFATGGVSHPETGSTGDGFAWLKEIGHTVQDPTPTIVPLKVRERWIKDLSGTSLPNVKVTFFGEGKRAFSKTGTILCTHFGISGPTVLNSAGKVGDLLYEGAVTAQVDLFPGEDVGILDRRITSIFDVHKNKALKNVFKEIVPPGTSESLLSCMQGIDPEKKVHSVTKAERRVIADTLKALPFTVSGLMGFEKAVVADGGVPLAEIDTKTMRSLRCKNLFIIGDLLHINRPTGGYSLQLCWTTGFVAGAHA